MPSFTSPFRWRIIAQMSNAYEIHDIDLLDKNFTDPAYASDAPWRMTLRYPNVWTPTVQKAATTRLGQVYLGFSRLPAARSAVDAQGITKGQLNIHADRGTSMTSKGVAELLADLGVGRTHGRPHVSNDNPYSEAVNKTLKYCRNRDSTRFALRRTIPTSWISMGIVSTT